MESVGEALPKEMARVRDEVMPIWVEIGPPGHLGLMLLRMQLDIAARAMAEGDVVGMIRAYQALKGIEL